MTNTCDNCGAETQNHDEVMVLCNPCLAKAIADTCEECGFKRGEGGNCKTCERQRKGEKMVEILFWSVLAIFMVVIVWGLVAEYFRQRGNH